MGGRGSSSGMTSKQSGLDVTANGTTTRYYFTSQNGVNYYQRGVGGTPEPTPSNMSAREFQQRVERNGATTKPVSAAERRREEQKHREDRETTNRVLDHAYANDRDMRSGSKWERVSRRGAR